MIDWRNPVTYENLDGVASQQPWFLNNHNVTGANGSYCSKEVKSSKTKEATPLHIPLGVEDVNKVLLLVLIFGDVYRAFIGVRSLHCKDSSHKVAQQVQLRHLLKANYTSDKWSSIIFNKNARKKNKKKGQLKSEDNTAAL